MLYYIFRPLIRVVLRAYFRKIYFTNLDKVPKGTPILYALNHPTSFIEPVLLASHAMTPYNFILRGDVYNSPKFVQWCLRSIKCIPIYRKSEGFTGMRKNQMTFDYCYELWHNKKGIQVLVEGHTKHEKRLRPIQKGAARMILGYYERYKDENFAIVPVGINYTDPHKFRSYASADFGDPIYIKKYLEANEENERKAVRMITVDIENALREKVIHIEKTEDDELATQLLEIHRNSQNFPIFPISDYKNDQPIKEEWKVVERFNKLDESEKESLKNKAKNYFEKLQKLKLNDVGIAKPGKGNLDNLLLLILGFIPFLIGAIFHAPVAWAGKKVADKVVKKIEFHASIRVGVWVVGGGFYYLIWFIVFTIIFGWVFALGALLLLWVFGHIALIIRDLFVEFTAARKFLGLKKEVRNELTEMRNALRI